MMDTVYLLQTPELSLEIAQGVVWLEILHWAWRPQSLRAPLDLAWVVRLAVRFLLGIVVGPAGCSRNLGVSNNCSGCSGHQGSVPNCIEDYEGGGCKGRVRAVVDDEGAA